MVQSRSRVFFKLNNIYKKYMANLIKSNNANIKIFGGKLSATAVSGGGNSLLTGLQAFYKLSDLTDSSGNNLTLTNNGNVTFASGKIGNAAVFDGSNYLERAPFNLGQNFSVSFWANPTDILDYSYWVLQYQGFCIYTRSNGSLEIGDGAYWNFVTAPGIAVSGVWKHYCLSVSNGVGSLYVNNVLEANSAGSPPLDLTDAGDRPFGISGDSQSGGTQVGVKQIDAVGIWNRALNEAEVSALYNSGNGLELN